MRLNDDAVVSVRKNTFLARRQRWLPNRTTLCQVQLQRHWKARRAAVCNELSGFPSVGDAPTKQGNKLRLKIFGPDPGGAMTVREKVFEKQ